MFLRQRGSRASRMSRVSDEMGVPLFFGTLSLVSLNVIGFGTQIKNGTKMVKKYLELGRHLLAKDIDSVAIQEPHLYSHAQQEGEYFEVKGFFDNIGYDFEPIF